jgi:hypothetical protein
MIGASQPTSRCAKAAVPNRRPMHFVSCQTLLDARTERLPLIESIRTQRDIFDLCVLRFGLILGAGMLSASWHLQMAPRCRFILGEKRRKMSPPMFVQCPSNHRSPSKSTSPNQDKNSISFVAGNKASRFSLGYEAAGGIINRFCESKRSRTFRNVTIPSSHILRLPSSGRTTSSADTRTLSCCMIVERGRAGSSMPSWSCLRSSIARTAAHGTA